MSEIKVTLNSSGIRELLQSPEMLKMCEERAAEICGRCGAGYGYDTRVGKTRVNATIRPETPAAIQDNLENNTLIKALK